MLCRDLIKLLEELIERNKPHEHMMGEAEIMIDQFAVISPDEPSKFYYKGISPDIRITPSSDCVYNILTAFTKDIK